MDTRIIHNGIREVTVLVASEGKEIARKGYEDQPLGKEYYLGKVWYIGDKSYKRAHVDKAEEFCEVDAPVNV